MLLAPYHPRTNYYLGLAYGKSPGHKDLAEAQLKLALEYTLMSLTGATPLEQKQLSEVAEQINNLLGN